MDLAIFGNAFEDEHGVRVDPREAAARRNPATPAGLRMYVITDNPTDHPGKFVVRAWDVQAGEAKPHAEAHEISDSLDDARGSIPDGLVMLPRSEDDDPVIVESWI
jgi:hypothetical protein